MKIRQAHHGDLATILQLRDEAASWLATLGSDQWSRAWPTYAQMVERIETAITAGEVWMAVDEYGVLGTVTVNTHTDPGLWSEAEQRTALFVHRMIVVRSAAGRQIGAELLDFACRQARAAGRGWLRLDAWTTNRDLHRYYERQGFRCVRIMPGHATPSAACFERPVRERRADTPDLAPNTPGACTLPTV